MLLTCFNIWEALTMSLQPYTIRLGIELDFDYKRMFKIKNWVKQKQMKMNKQIIWLHVCERSGEKVRSRQDTVCETLTMLSRTALKTCTIQIFRFPTTNWNRLWNPLTRFENDLHPEEHRWRAIILKKKKKLLLSIF